LGIGDEIIGTGFARGAAARGVKIAFGDRRRIIWGPWCEAAFQGNPNIARTLQQGPVEWIEYYKGKRGYNRQDIVGKRWIWNYDFKAVPGEFFFSDHDRACAIRRPLGVLIEPNVPWHKSVAPNKDWGLARYQRLADMLQADGFSVYQNSFGTARLTNVNVVHVPSFRQVAASLTGYDLIICPEGGLHHAAAAVGAKAIVIFGGFIPPQVTGYEFHVNLTGGAEACGSWNRCQHCRDALDRITVEKVHERALAALQNQEIAASA
jgi:hypothetical protein